MLMVFLMAGVAPAPSSLIDTSVIVAVVALIGTLGSVYLANRYTARNAREAAQKSVMVEQNKLDETRRQSLMDNMQEEITRMVEMRRQDREEYIRVRAEDRDDFSRRLAEQKERLEVLSREHEQYRRERTFLQQQVDALVLWSRAVVRVMRGAGVQYPPPPRGVDTDPEGFPPLRGSH